ncbi:MAG: Zinc ABC transporter, permease protein ZnuB, partial [uncultured Blastococcus sp.]
ERPRGGVPVRLAGDPAELLHAQRLHRRLDGGRRRRLAGLLRHHPAERLRRARPRPHRVPRGHRRDPRRRTGHPGPGGVLRGRRAADRTVRPPRRRPRGGHRDDPRPGHRVGRAVRLAGQRQRQHDDLGPLRQPAGDLQRPAARVRRLHRRRRGRPGSHRPAARLRLGRPGRRRGAGGSGAGPRRHLRRPAGPHHHDGRAGGRHAAAVRPRGDPGGDRAATDGATHPRRRPRRRHGAGLGLGRTGALGDGRPAAQLLRRVAGGARLGGRAGLRRTPWAGLGSGGRSRRGARRPARL